jgi:hypothetical protein
MRASSSPPSLRTMLRSENIVPKMSLASSLALLFRAVAAALLALFAVPRAFTALTGSDPSPPFAARLAGSQLLW